MHLPTLNTLDALDNLLKHPAGPSSRQLASMV